MSMEINVLAVSDFRKRLSTAFLHKLRHNPLTLLSHSKPIAVVIDYQEYEAMQAELELLKERQFQEMAARLREMMQARQCGDITGMKTLQELTQIFELNDQEERP